MKQELPGQVGNNHPTNSPMGVFKSSDGYFTIAPTPGMYTCAAIGRDDRNHADYATAQDRAKNRTALNTEIDSATSRKESAAWTKIMNETGVPCGPTTLAETSPTRRSNTSVSRNGPIGALGEVTLIGQAIHMSRTPNKLVAGTAECGAHTDEILAELGYGNDQVTDLRETGVV